MTLENNLREIYCAITCPEHCDTYLVGDPSGTRIYDSKSVLGRFWHWFHGVKEHFIHRNPLQENLKEAILHTHTIFHQQLSLVTQELACYKKYLINSGKGYAVKEDDYFKARSAITDWNAATAPFMKMLQTHPNSCVDTLFANCFPEHPENTLRGLFLPTSANELQECQRIIDILWGNQFFPCGIC